MMWRIIKSALDCRFITQFGCDQIINPLIVLTVITFFFFNICDFWTGCIRPNRLLGHTDASAVAVTTFNTIPVC